MRTKAAIPGELTSLATLIAAVLRWPIWLLQALLGRAQAAEGLRPLWVLVDLLTRARATAVLIGLHGAVFLAEQVCLLRGWPKQQLLAVFALRATDVAAGHWVPLLLHQFSHASVEHMLTNCVALLVFGRLVERQLGPGRLVLAYGLSALTSTLTSLAVAFVVAGRALHQPTLGASGAVAGLVALGILLSPLSLSFELGVPLPVFVLGWLTMLADGLAVVRATHTTGGLSALAFGTINHPSHLGGYLAAPLFLVFVSAAERQRARLGLLIHLVFLGVLLTLWHVFLAT